MSNELWYNPVEYLSYTGFLFLAVKRPYMRGKGERIWSIYEIFRLAEERKCVWTASTGKRPAAFVLNFQAMELINDIRKGKYYTYIPKGNERTSGKAKSRNVRAGKTK